MDKPAGEISHNITRLGHLDIPGGGQVVVQGNHAFVGHMKPPQGTTIIDITNPADPTIIWQTKTDTEFSPTHKVRVAGDIMITNVEMNNRHFLRLGTQIPKLRIDLEREGKEPTDKNIAAVLGVKTDDIPILEASRKREYSDGGFKVWDISKIQEPIDAHKVEVDYATYIDTDTDVRETMSAYDWEKSENEDKRVIQLIDPLFAAELLEEARGAYR